MLEDYTSFHVMLDVMFLTLVIVGHEFLALVG